MKKPKQAQHEPKTRITISDTLLAQIGNPKNATRFPIQRYEPPPGVLPPEQKEAIMAMDATDYSYLSGGELQYTSYGYGGFPGYPYLSNLAQITEYRNATQIIAEECTRRFIDISGDDTVPDDVVDRLNAEVEKFKIRNVFKKVAEHDGYFGRGQIFIDIAGADNSTLSTWENSDELAAPLILSPRKIRRGSVLGFRVIEPIWTYPGVYNADNPMSPMFYKPERWFIMGRTVHNTRLITMVSNEVPDILKAAYNFGGVSRSQLIETYVQNWLRTRDSVSDIIHSFVVYGLKTDLENLLKSGNDIEKRAELFNKYRDNRGLFVINNDEEFFNYSTSIGELHHLQSQSQEQMSSATRIPLVKFTGITPSGLNASSEGEIRVFYDTIHSLQEALFRDGIKKVLDILQLNEFGQIYEGITFKFVPLFEITEKEQAELDWRSAQADSLRVESGVISPADAKARMEDNLNIPGSQPFDD